MSDSSARLSSLAVLGGPLHGKTLQLSTGLEEITIGSDPSCRFQLDIAGVSAQHARIVADETGAAVFDAPGSRGLFLNFEKVEGRAGLHDGDMLRLGPPQERDSVMIQLEFGGDLLEGEEPAIFASSEPGPAAVAGLTLEPEASAPAPEAPIEFESAETPGPAYDADAEFIAELSSADDDAFVITDEPEAPPPPAEPAAMAPPPVAAAETVAAPEPVAAEPEPTFDESPMMLEEAPAVTDDFFVASEIEAPVPPAPAPMAPAPPLPAPPAPAPMVLEDPEPSGAPTSSVAFEMPAGDFALPGFDPNWAAPPAAPAGGGFFADVPAPPVAEDDGFALPPLDTARPQAQASPAPAPLEGFDLGGDDQALVFDEPLLVSSKAPAAAPPPAPVLPEAAPAPVPMAPQPVAARPRPAATSAPGDTPARPRPTRRPPEEGSTPTPSRSSRSGANRGRPAPSSLGGRYVALGGGGLIALGLIAFLVTRFMGGGPKIAVVDPSRVKVGQTLAVSGGPFSADPSANEVLFGDKPGSVLEAESTRLKVQVPDLGLSPGKDVTIALKVRVGGKESRSFDLTVFGGPTIVGISPDVAMPGEEVVLSGSGWGAAPTVHFGEVVAEVLQVAPASIRVRVPNLAGGPGTAAAAVVKDGPAESNPAPFFLGRIPLLTKVEPVSAVPGDLVTLTGRGFRREPAQNTVTIGGARALVTVAVDSELRVVAPFNAIGGSGGLELRVPASEHVAQAPATIQPSSDTVEFHFAAQPFDVPGREHAVLWTGLGPAFVVAASSGKTAGERAYDAQKKLNEAGNILKASRDVDIELRNPDTAPALALTGKTEVLLEVTDEDVAAFNEDWTGLKGRGGPITRARLAQWWTAVAKDLVLLLVRGQKPVNAAGLAPEGRVLVDVSLAAQKTGRFGVPWSVVSGFRPPQRDAMRLLALRVPPTVTGPGGAPPPGPQTAALKLEGSWVGTQVEAGQRRYISAVFSAGGGTISMEAAVTLSLPLLTLEARKNEARFSLQFRGGTRYYVGKWDGNVLTGTIATDSAGREAVGTFELKPR